MRLGNYHGYALAVSVLAFSWWAASAATVTGYVGDVAGVKPNNPLKDVKAVLRDTSSGKEYAAKDKTDDGGTYKIDEVPPGAYTLILTRVDYQQTAPIDPVQIKAEDANNSVPADDGQMWKKNATKKYLDAVGAVSVAKAKQGKADKVYERLWLDTRVAALPPTSKQYLVAGIAKQDGEAATKFPKFNSYLLIKNDDLTQTEASFKGVWTSSSPKTPFPTPKMVKGWNVDDEIVIDLIIYQKKHVATSPFTEKAFFEQFDRDWEGTKARMGLTDFTDWTKMHPAFLTRPK